MCVCLRNIMRLKMDEIEVIHNRGVVRGLDTLRVTWREMSNE